MSRKSLQATKSHYKNKRPIRKAFPNKWETAVLRSHCCDKKAVNDNVVDKNGVKILGEANILNKLPVSASNLYAKNVFNFVSNLYDKENNKLNINLEDEIIEKTLIK